MQEILIDIDLNQRIDKFLCEKLSISRKLCKDMFDKELVMVNDKVAKPSYLLKMNDLVCYEELELEQYSIKPVDLKLKYLYDDEYLCVVNKPSGMVVHPAPGAMENTLVHGLLYDLGDSLSGINGVMRPGIVHRIDKDTSGLLLVAKNDFAHESLAKQLELHTIKREYVALVYGIINEERGKINAPIGRDPVDRLKQAVLKDGKNAITNFTVLKRFKDMTLISLRLETGRTHQIRVHMKYIGHPVVGDPIYGPRKVIGENGQFLHAKTIGFIHPKTNEYMEFTSDLPEYFTKYLNELE